MYGVVERTTEAATSRNARPAPRPCETISTASGPVASTRTL